jgi:hypothetical protein
VRALVALLLFTLPLSAAPVPKALKKPLPSPDGVWRLVEFNTDGQNEPVRDAELDWVIAGEHIFPRQAVEPAHGDKGPPNFTTPDESRPHRRLWGDQPAVLVVSDTTLQLCVATDGRQEVSECRPGKGVWYYTFERSR